MTALSFKIIPVPLCSSPTFEEGPERMFLNLPVRVAFVILDMLYKSEWEAPAHLGELSFFIYGSQVTNPSESSDWDVLVQSKNPFKGVSYEGHPLHVYIPGLGPHLRFFNRVVDLTLTSLPMEEALSKIYTNTQHAEVCILKSEEHPDRELKDPKYLEKMIDTIVQQDPQPNFNQWKWRVVSCIPELTIAELRKINGFCALEKIILHPNPGDTKRAVFRWVKSRVLDGSRPGTWEMLQKIHDETVTEMIRQVPEKFAKKVHRIASALFRNGMSQDQKQRYALCLIVVVFGVSKDRHACLRGFQNHFLALLAVFEVEREMPLDKQIEKLQRTCNDPGLNKETFEATTQVLVENINKSPSLSRREKDWLIHTVTKGDRTTIGDVSASSASPETTPLPVLDKKREFDNIITWIESGDADGLKAWVIENKWVYDDIEHESLAGLISKRTDKTEKLKAALFACSVEGVVYCLKSREELRPFLDRLRTILGTNWVDLLTFIGSYEEEFPDNVKFVREYVVSNRLWITMSDGGFVPREEFFSKALKVAERTTEQSCANSIFGGADSDSDSDSDSDPNSG